MAQSLEERLRSRLSSAVKQVAVEMSTMSVTGYLVKRLVVSGTFRNIIKEDGTVEGFQIQLKNKLGGASIIGCTPPTIDGEIFEPSQVRIHKGAQVFRGDEISESNPLNTNFGDEMTIVVEDDQGLESGNHKIMLGLKMAGIGIVETSLEEEISGEGRPRVKKRVATGAGAEDFSAVMKKTVDMAIEKIGEKTIAESSKTVRGLVLDLGADGVYGVKVNTDGTAEYVEGPVSGDKVLTIKMSKSTFHNMAHNKLNPGMAYAKGDVKLEGIPVLKLRGMDKFLTAIFASYRAASDGVELEDADLAGESGIIEEMLGMLVMGVDEALKAIDRALGIFGVNYFYEKSLNRVERVWDALDREVRKVIAFGQEEEDGEKPQREEATAEAPKEKPAAGKTLRDKLKERINAAVDSAVSEIARSSVSSFLVKKLIEPGSFRNYEADGEAAGFEVKLKNKLGNATIIGFAEIELDGADCPLDTIDIIKGRNTIVASDISKSRPLQANFGDELLIRVARPGGLEAGKHRVHLGIEMVGLGIVEADYEESLSA